MKIKKSYIALALIGIMFFSTIAFSVIQGAFNSPTANGPAVELPSTNIIDQQLSEPQENLALQQGLTIITFRYGLNCGNCTEAQQLLESVAFDKVFGRQVVLSEINDAGVRSPEAIFMSIYGRKQISNITVDNVVNVLCDLVISPPATCALLRSKQ